MKLYTISNVRFSGQIDYAYLKFIQEYIANIYVCIFISILQFSSFCLNRKNIQIECDI